MRNEKYFHIDDTFDGRNNNTHFLPLINQSDFFPAGIKNQKIYLRDATIQKFNSLRSRGDLDFQFHNLQLTRERSIDL